MIGAHREARRIRTGRLDGNRWRSPDDRGRHWDGYGHRHRPSAPAA
jgi:hypothetical protein